MVTSSREVASDVMKAAPCDRLPTRSHNALKVLVLLQVLGNKLHAFIHGLRLIPWHARSMPEICYPWSRSDLLPM